MKTKEPLNPGMAQKMVTVLMPYKLYCRLCERAMQESKTVPATIKSILEKELNEN